MYGKIFESIYDGTLSDHWQALITFQQMIVLCDSEGILDMTPSALSRRTGIPMEHIQEGIKVLEREDQYSRTPDEDGRRIIRLDENRAWGWCIINHAYYRGLASREDKKKADRERIAAKRAESKGVARGREVSQGVADVAHTDADTNTDAIKKKTIKKKDDFQTLWAAYPKKKSKGQAEKTFRKLLNENKLPSISTLIDAIAAQKAGHDWQKDQGQYIPHLSTWLNAKGWADEVTTLNGNKGSAYNFPVCRSCGDNGSNIIKGDSCPYCEQIA